MCKRSCHIFLLPLITCYENGVQNGVILENGVKIPCKNGVKHKSFNTKIETGNTLIQVFPVFIFLLSHQDLFLEPLQFYKMFLQKNYSELFRFQFDV